MSKCVYSAIKTPDGTILESLHRHDYRTHIDAVSGEEYMIDGGLDYMRGNINQVRPEYLSVCIEDGHDAVRNAARWGTYGKNGDEPLHYVLLKDMETDHIKAVLEMCKPHPNLREAMQNELAFRE